MFVSKKTYQALQEQYGKLADHNQQFQIKNKALQEQVEEAQLSVSVHLSELARLNREIAALARQQDVYSLLIKDCLQWMSEITLPKKTAGTADKERRREKLCQEAKALGIVQREETV